MASSELKGFKKFCTRWLPFLLVRCPGGNWHYAWAQTCSCCMHENGETYFYKCDRDWRSAADGKVVKVYSDGSMRTWR